MTREEYDAIDALNFSKARHILRSPEHFLEKLNEADDPHRYLVARMVHSVIIESKDLYDIAAVKCDGLNLATKEGKAWKAKQDLPIISPGEAYSILSMAERVAQHRQAYELLTQCCEREVVVTGEYKGVKTKGRLDAVGRPFKRLCDLKTTADARAEAFANHCMQFDYDLQAVWYKSFFPGYSFDWIVVENTPPHAVKVWPLRPPMEISGIEKLTRLFNIYSECRAKNKWAANMSIDYADDNELLDPPYRRIKELQGAGLL